MTLWKIIHRRVYTASDSRFLLIIDVQEQRKCEEGIRLITVLTMYFVTLRYMVLQGGLLFVTIYFVTLQYIVLLL